MNDTKITPEDSDKIFESYANTVLPDPHEDYERRAVRLWHHQYGKGRPVYGEHAPPRPDGTIDWWSVVFEDVGEKRVPVGELHELQPGEDIPAYVVEWQKEQKAKESAGQIDAATGLVAETDKKVETEDKKKKDDRQLELALDDVQVKENFPSEEDDKGFADRLKREIMSQISDEAIGDVEMILQAIDEPDLLMKISSSVSLGKEALLSPEEKQAIEDERLDDRDKAHSTAGLPPFSSKEEDDYRDEETPEEMWGGPDTGPGT